LARQIAALERNPEAGFSFSAIWNLVDTEQSRIPSEPFFPVALRKWMARNFKHEGAVSGRVYELLLEVNCIATSSLVIRRDVVEPIGLFDEALSNGEDYEFELRLARQCPAVFVVEPTSRYRVHESGLSGNWSARSDLFYGANLRVLENHYRAYPSSSVKKAMAQTCAGYALYFLSAGDRQSAARYALRSFQLSASPRALKCYVQAVMPKSYRLLSALAGTYRRSDSKSQ
jgi:GT2 family glycosyltransferase